MKLPWDKKYIKIAFHVVVTMLILYVMGLLIWNMTEAKDLLLKGIGTLISVFAPLLVAIVFSFLINPLVEFLQRQWQKWIPVPQRQAYSTRKRGTASAYVLLLILIAFAGRYVAYKIGATDVEAFADKINHYVQDFTDLFVLLNVKLTEYGLLQNVEGILSSWTIAFSNFVQSSILSITNSITRAGSWAINLVLGLTIAFYLLVEKENIIQTIKNVVDVFFPKKIAENIKGFGHEVNAVFSGYIGGQITDAIIMATMVSVAFSFVGIPYAVMIGIISGFSNLIPYVGAVVAFILSVAMGLLSGDPIKALYAVIIVLILQQIDSIIIVPKVVGKSVELHPALVLLSLSVFGGLFGLIGMIVAVPCGALIKIFSARFYQRKKLERERLELEAQEG